MRCTCRAATPGSCRRCVTAAPWSSTIAASLSPGPCRLLRATALTRPGGVVLYATCSPHLAETVGVAADALRRHPVRALDTRPLFEPLDKGPAEGLGEGPYVQLWPHRHGTDAMFVAALRRLT